MRILTFFLLFLTLSNLCFGLEINEDNKNENYINLTDSKNLLQNPGKEKNLEVDNQTNSIKKEENKNQKTISKSEIIKGKLESPSLGSIGIETKLNKKFGYKIWNNFNSNEAINFLNYVPDVVSSKTFQKFLIDIYSSVSIPPSGNSDEIVKFLETRLLRLSSLGQTKILNDIINQLPNSKRWEKWKKWQIEYNLMMKNDEDACKIVQIFLKKDSSLFWQKANVICLLINQKFNEAKFIHDVMDSESLIDNVFSNLIKNVVNGEISKQIEMENLRFDPFHIVMLDILKFPISAEMVASLDSEYLNPLMDLIYLDAEARSFVLDKLLSIQEIDREKTIEVYQSFLNFEKSSEQALKDLLKNSNGINRANVWLSTLKMDDNLKKAEYILKILKIENNYGRLTQSLDLYVPILDNLDKKSLSSSINSMITYLKIVHNPKKYKETELSKMLLLVNESSWNFDIISKHNAWPFIDYAEKMGLKEPNINWNSILQDKNLSQPNSSENTFWIKNINYENFSLNRLVEQKINQNQPIHALLLIARMFRNRQLNDFDLSELLNIERHLKNIGLNSLSEEIRLEILTAKFTNLDLYYD